MKTFYWSMLLCDIENEDDSNEMLKEVIKLWVTTCGFSIVSSWLERFKRITDYHQKEERTKKEYKTKSRFM